jgi:putative transposase
MLKLLVSKACGDLSTATDQNQSRIRRKERHLWQRRFWEHHIRDEADFAAHCDYIHYNPVKHGLCEYPADWPYSTFSRFVERGLYTPDWGMSGEPCTVDNVGKE